MNEDVLKPFPCKKVGCGMSFFTEDHLSVHHQAKHNQLNLEIPKGSSIQIFCKINLEFCRRSNFMINILADQTPTPTRLLNNCEELRVFDDLQNINPFEEGFRRAVEDNTNGIVNCFLSTPSNQDTLHTPQILPQFEIRPVKNEPNGDAILPEQPKNLTVPSTPEDSSYNIPKPSREPEPSQSNVNDLRKLTHFSASIPLLPKPSIIYAAPILTGSNGSHSNSIGKSNESVKDKLKNILLSNSVSQNDKKRIKVEPDPKLSTSAIFIGSVPLITTPANIIINNHSNKFRLTSNDDMTPSDGVNHKSSDNGSGSRKRSRVDKPEASNLKVERNRAAARRYR